jgi:GTP-binding protein
MTAPRGTDPRLLQSTRRTTSERREQYYDLMDAKAEARAEVEAERRAARDWSAEEGDE